MRRAVIDIGTNTVKLLVADVQDGKIIPILSKDRTTRLGEGLVARASGLRSSHSSQPTAAGEMPVSPKLSPAAIARTIQTVNDFLDEARSLGAPDVLALTTSATRDAENRGEFLDGVRDKCGLEVRVITGECEAELIFRGVSSDPEWSNQPILVLDVGGGSAELVQGQAGRIELFQSLPLGALRLTEQFGEGKFTELCDYLRATLRQTLASYSVRNRRMIGTGGTITTLALVCRASASLAETQRRQPERLPYNSIDRMSLMLDELHTLVAKLNTLPLAERKRVPGLPPERADIIVAGGAVFLVAMEVLEVKELTVSVRNLRYGALVDG